MCPICSEEKYSKVGKPKIGLKAEKLIRKDYDVVRCLSCGFYYVQPDIDLSSSEWQKLYELGYFVPLTPWHAKHRDKDRKDRFDKLEKYSDKQIKTFLDVGCGEGLCLIEAISRGWEGYGTDITDHRIEEAKNNKIIFKETDLISANFPENFFDCIYVDSVLEHVLNPMEYLTELYRITNSGGVVYIGVPNEDALYKIVLKLLYNLTGRKMESAKLKPFAEPFHVGGFTKNSLKLAIKQSSFKIVRLNNFASKTDILNFKFFSKGFIMEAFFLPVIWIAVPLRMEVYLETYLKK